MIYFDNAATTYPKPESVLQAVNTAMRKYGANPGRSGHRMAMETAREIYGCRSLLSDFFGAPGAEYVCFTQNCTYAINTVLKGMLREGDHVVVSSLEHNSVMRPLEELGRQGITYTKAGVTPEDNDATVDSFRNALRSNTKLIFCMQASNVFGIRLPVERIAALGKLYGIPVGIDAAQSAGLAELNMKQSGISFLCAPGHKGLYGPMGTGFLITSGEYPLTPLAEGGTGTGSVSLSMPESPPERFESGTLNVPGIIGLSAGVRFVQKTGRDRILRHETELMSSLYEELKKTDGVRLYTGRPDEKYYVPVLSFNVDGIDSEDLARMLSSYGIAVRAGLHCAPAAHESMGTLRTGTVRVCPSAFSNAEDCRQLLSAIRKIKANHKKNLNNA